MKAEHPSCVKRNTLKWKLISWCINTLKPSYLYLVYILSENDVFTKQHSKTSRTKAEDIKITDMWCVYVCVCVFRQLEMYLVKMKEFKKKNRSDLVQFDLSVVIRHLLSVHSILVNL